MMMPKKLLLLLCLIMVGISACDVFSQPTPTPIFVTATPAFIIVTSTPSPSPSPVLAPTLEFNEADLLATASATPSPTLTPAITQTRTFTPTPTDTPVTPGAIIGFVGGISATQAACTTIPLGGFGVVFTGNPEIAAQIGCPLGSSSAVSVNNAYQTYERGIMIWVSSIGETGQPGIYAIFNNGTYQRFNDTWRDGIDPVNVGMSPPGGLSEPIRGFGKVWREAAGVRDGLGWATSGESGGTGFVQTFERGDMIYVSQNGLTYTLVSATGTWISAAQSY